MQYNIVYADDSGGVKTVSESLFIAFSRAVVKANIINLNCFGSGVISSFYRSFRYLSQLNKNDVLVLQHFSPIFLGLILRLLGFKKIINVVHTDLYEYYKNSFFLKKIIIRMVFYFLKNEVVVFVSKESEAKAKIKFNLKNTITIYNIYSFPVDKPVRKKIGDKIKLGSISRLNKTKNIYLLIRVLKDVVTISPGIELLIYGSGDQQEDLEKYIKSQNCEDYIKLVGFSEDKNKMYSSIDAMISFSSIEGFGMTILESIGYGIPVFYTDCSSGPRELMSPDTDPLAKTVSYEKTNIGYLVKPTQKTAAYSDELDDYESEYVDIMLAFINDLKSNKFSMVYDTARFSEETIVKQWQELIETLN